MSKDGKVTALIAAALLLSSLSLGGCMTSTAGSSLMDARAEAPALPKTSVYLPVEDLPPKREKPAMTVDERSKLQAIVSGAMCEPLSHLWKCASRLRRLIRCEGLA